LIFTLLYCLSLTPRPPAHPLTLHPLLSSLSSSPLVAVFPLSFSFRSSISCLFLLFLSFLSLALPIALLSNAHSPTDSLSQQLSISPSVPVSVPVSVSYFSTVMSTDSFSPVQSIGDQRTHRYIKLASNGMPVVIISDPTTDFAAASLCVGVGSASDPRPFDGLAHFLEHMLFLGTAKYPNESEFHTFLSSNAGYSNAWTSYFQTNYHFQVSPSAFDGALDRFAQFFISPLFQTDMTNREIEAVNNEHAKNITEVICQERYLPDEGHEA
jgi:hypothetical protein